jgi:uncharacterized membrane protein
MRGLSLVSTALIIIGIFNTTFLMMESNCPNGVCRISPFPFPEWVLPALAIVWFGLGFAIFHKNLNKLVKRTWQVLGVGTVAFLFPYSLIIHHYCLNCYIDHAVGLTLVALSLKRS